MLTQTNLIKHLIECFVLILYFHLRLSPPSGLLILWFRTKVLYSFILSTCVLHLHFHPPWFDRSSIWRRLQTTRSITYSTLSLQVQDKKSVFKVGFNPLTLIFAQIKGKCKVSLSTTQWGHEGTALDRGEWSASRHSRFTLGGGETSRYTLCGRFGQPQSRSGHYGKKKNLAPTGNQTPTAHRYTDWTYT
jgi:hypothetical protein